MPPEQPFSDPDTRAYSKDFLSEVRTNLRDADRELRRTALLILLLGFIFELANRGGIEEFSVMFVKVTDTRIIREAIPVVVAYLTGTLLASALTTLYLSTVHQQVIMDVFPKLADCRFDLALEPSMLLIGPRYKIVPLQWMPFLRGNAAFALARWVFLVGLPLAFEVYAYLELFSELGPNPRLIVGCVISALLVTYSLLLLVPTQFYFVSRM
jgi:hypothetical protein